MPQVFIFLFLFLPGIYNAPPEGGKNPAPCGNHFPFIDSLHFTSALDTVDAENDTIFSREFFWKDLYDLPFFVQRDSHGYFKNIWSDLPLSAMDTTPQLITAKGYSTCRGYHDIDKASACFRNDTLFLAIGVFNPGYYDNFRFAISKGKFFGSFYTQYVHGYKEGSIYWRTMSQKIYLSETRPKKGDWIKGKAEFECMEYQNGKENRPVKMECYFKLRVE